MKVWASGIIQDSAVETTSLNYTMHYASPCAWEGIRSYLQQNGKTEIFQLDVHINRLFDSARIMNFTIPHTKDEVKKACVDLVEACGGGDLYLRPIAYSINAAEKAKPQLQGIKLDIYAFTVPALHSEKKGIKMCISSFRRGYPQFQMQAKSASNYHFLQSIKHELEAGTYDDAFLTDNEGYITEATVANVWIYKNGIAMTPPNDGSILPGVTRKAVSDIIHKSGHPIVIMEKKITRADIYTADCIILCGTYAEIVSVVEVDGRKFSEDHHFYKMVKEGYLKLVRGHE